MRIPSTLKFGVLSLAACLVACGGGGVPDAITSPVAAEVTQGVSTAQLGKSFLMTGRAVSQPNLMESAGWTVTKLTASAPDLVVSNADCATAEKNNRTTNSTNQSTWTCDVVVAAPSSLTVDSTYRLTFSGNDSNGNAGSAYRDVTIQAGQSGVTPTPPVATTQASVTAAAGDDVGLNCFATGGTVGADSAYRIQWVLKSNPAGLPVTFESTAEGALTFKAPAVRSTSSLTFQCRVTDDNLATSVADSVVTINAGSTVSAVAITGAAQTVAPGEVVTLDGSQSSAMDSSSLYFTWTQTEGPAVTLAGASSAMPTFVAPTVSSSTRLVFRMTAQTTPNNAVNAVPSEIAEAVVYVDPLPPLTLGISAATATTSGSPVSLTVNATPVAGSTLYYEWTQVSGPSVTLGAANTNVSSFIAPTVGAGAELVFSVKVARKPIAQAAPNEIASTDVVVRVNP